MEVNEIKLHNTSELGDAISWTEKSMKNSLKYLVWEFRDFDECGTNYSQVYSDTEE